MEEEKEIFGRMALGLTAMYGVYRVFQFAIRRQMAEPSLGLQMLLAFVLYGVGFFLLLLLFLTPLFEELAFRIIPGDRLLPEQKNFYVLASALLFGLAHWPTAGWKTVIVTFYLGLIWANVYAQTRSLPIVVVLHILYNLLSGGITTLLGGISPLYRSYTFLRSCFCRSSGCYLRFANGGNDGCRFLCRRKNPGGSFSKPKDSGCISPCWCSAGFC